MRLVWSKHVEMPFLSSLAWEALVNTFSDTFCVLAGMGVVWSTHFEIHFIASLAWEGFGQHKLRYSLCLRWHEIFLVITSCDIFFVLAGMGGVWPTRVVMHFDSSLAL